jgi:hypothetical protein
MIEKGEIDVKITLGNDVEVTLLPNGEYRRFLEDAISYYLCTGTYNVNKIIFQYIDITNEPVDFVQTIIDNLPEAALHYLIDVLNENDNILVRLTYYPGEQTGFEIYYQCDCESNEVEDLIDYILKNNDFACEEWKYTEIINGHQRYIGQED